MAPDSYIAWLEANRERPATEYRPPPAKLKWQMYVAAALLPSISGADKAVLVCLIDHANARNGRCDPSEPTIARELNMAMRTVRRSIARLIAGELIARLRRGRVGRGGRSSNAYGINWPALAHAFESYKQRRAPVTADRNGRP